MQQLPNNWCFCVLTIKIYIDMSELKDLLNLSSLKSTKEIEGRFEDIAEKLLIEYQIKKGDICYDILEIEFYYYSKNHPDIITYPRNSKGGEWFFHESGVDLTLVSQTTYSSKEPQVGDDDSFGGILIRSLLKRENNKSELICGPLKCEWELFDKFDAFNVMNDEIPQIVARDSKLACGIENRERWIKPSTPKNKYSELKNKYNIKDEDDDKCRKEFFNYIGVDCLERAPKYRYYIKDVPQDASGTLKSYNANPWKLQNRLWAEKLQ